ncbi:SufE family protein [Antarcticirhabdus aurantiaca]|uniref:SufE family protein n=1 Tax=Antarcticirhabdus aurantiaca TaxID=2606717 RepID=A0ACD4NIY8_9HYPH|nr:SufE family protein [Antarcticirhabdus aurantiaca]WAJ26726.1 SufE family protein [Jeongeuplla avenae]
MTPTIDDIRGDFELLDDWEDRYRYLIELGRTLEPMPDGSMNDETKVRGCVSQVWLLSHSDDAHPPHLSFQGESDAHIVRGLVAVALAIFSGKTAPEILDTDAEAVFAEFGLQDHLTPQRSNGLRSMVNRIKNDARAALDQAA